MLVTWTDLAVGIGVVAILLIAAYIATCYYRVFVRRKAALSHAPQPDEIWVQDDTIIYIDAATPNGVEWMTIDPLSKSILKHKDTWGEWRKRLEVRTVWFTGQKRPLGPVA